MSLTPDIVQSALMTPLWLSDVSAWIQHIPMANVLMHLTQPRTLVELGTHKGDSYMAFCQAVRAMKLPTRCTAIDTWTGDVQAGEYDGGILAALRKHHDPLYGSFSTLLQSTFDAAVARFADASIDLLHIDGLHTYEAVKHDFTTWLPKLSSRAVVLFHDTAVTEGDFGVHRLWAEIIGHGGLEKRYFHFSHGYGLGVVALGPQVPQPMVDFLAFANDHPELVRGLMASLGHRLELTRGLSALIAQLRMQIAVMNEWRAVAGHSPMKSPEFAVPALADGAVAHELTIPLFWQSDDPKKHLDAFYEVAVYLTAELGPLCRDNSNLLKSHHVLSGHVNELQAQNNRLQQQITEQQKVGEQLQAMQQQITMMTSSRYWRIGRKLAKIRLLRRLLGFPG